MQESELKILCGKAEKLVTERGGISVPLVQSTLGISYLAARDVVNRLVEYKIIEFIGGVEYKPVKASSLKVQALLKQIAESRNTIDMRLGEAAVICAQDGYVTAANIQRRMGIGYMRAVRMRDSMFTLGMLGECDGGDKRRFLFTEAEVREAFGMESSDQTSTAPSDAINDPADSGDPPGWLSRLRGKVGDSTDESTEEGVGDDEEKDDEDDDDDEILSLDEILKQIEYEQKLDDCINVLCGYFFAESKETLLRRIRDIGGIVREKFPSAADFYNDTVKRLEGYDDSTARDKFGNICDTKIQIYQTHAKYLKMNSTGERLLYAIHEGMLRIVEQNRDADTKQLIAVAEAEAAACAEDRLSKFIVDNVAVELMRFDEERLPFLKAEALRAAGDVMPHEKIDIAYVIDGSEGGALFDYARCVFAAIEKRMQRNCHSKIGNSSSAFRERIVCYGNGAVDGEDTVTQFDFTEMPYGKALLRAQFADRRNKKKNAESVSNGLEGLWAAMQSEWSEIENDYGKHIIVVLTNNAACKPQESRIIRNDDEDYPDDFDEYRRAWDGESGISSISQNNKILVVCAPRGDGTPAVWDRVKEFKNAYGKLDGCKTCSPEKLADYVLFALNDSSIGV